MKPKSLTITLGATFLISALYLYPEEPMPIWA
jgi:hypothetical protein